MPAEIIVLENNYAELKLTLARFSGAREKILKFPTKLLYMHYTLLYRRINFVNILFISTLLIQSCNNSSDTNAVSSVDDTINYHKNETDAAFNSLHKKDDAIGAAGRQMILMQIDSTCRTISLLDSAKQQLADISPSAMSITERNKRSKIIFNINLLQNELIREMDATILINLKNRTHELNSITLELEKNAAHLTTVVQQLNKVTQCVSRLTNMLAEGVSRGFIKPHTPKGVPAETIKASIE